MKKNFTKVIFLILVLALTIVPVLAVSSFAEGETVTFDVPLGVDTPSMNADGTLPEAEAPDGYTFVGWTESPMNVEKNTAPADLIEAGVAYSGTATKLYALYSRTEEGTSGESITTYTLVKDASTLAEGDVIVIAASDYDYALSTTQNTNNRGQASITKSGETITFDNTVQLITLEAGTTDDTLAFNVGSGYLYAAGGTKTNNYLKTKTTLDATSSWNITITSAGVATIKTSDSTVARHTIMYNKTSSLFSCYASGQQSVSIYKQTVTTSSGEDTIYYSTMTSYTANFVGPDGAVNELRSADNIITVPVAPTYDEGAFDAQVYEFAGWSATKLAVDGTTKPDMLDATTLELTEDVTYYAVYTYTVGEGDPDSWQLVTDASTLVEGDQVIIAAKDYDYALSTTQNNNNRGQADVTKNTDNNTVTFGDGVQTLTLKKGYVDNTFAFYTGSGYLYAASSSSNYLRTETSLSANSSWTITVEDGAATIKAQGTNTKNLLRYNSSNKIFAAYGSGQQDICLYRFDKGDLTTFYTSKLKDAASDVTEFDSASVTIGSDLAMNYFISLKTGEVISDYSMKFTFNGEETVVETATLVGDKYMFTFSGITPEKMGDNIKSELFKDDEVVCSYDKYSVKENLITVRDEVPETTDEQKTLIDATLVYGAAAQQYRDYNTDNLVGDIPDTLTGPDAAKVRAKTESTVEGLKFTAAGVNFDYCNRVYIKYENTTVTDAEVKVFISGTQCATKVVENNGVITVYSDALKATELGSTVRFEIWQNGVEVQELKYSVNDYVFTMKDTEDTALKNLIFALYQYGVAAKACN